MRQAVVSVGPESLNEHGFEFDLFRDAGVLETEILSCEGSRGVLRIHVEEPLDPDRLDAMDAIQWWEQVPGGGTASVYLIEAAQTDVTDAPPADAGFPRCEQLRVTDQGLTLTLAGSQTRLHDELAHLDGTWDDVALETLRAYRAQEEPLDALTDRQRDVLERAFERGYFDVPRRVSVAELAAEFGLDDSTVAEHLQRAERNLLRSLFDSSA